jgi:CheY-like chemotaxis protein
MGSEELSRALAQQVIERWKLQGFDTVGCYDHGYCYPANSRLLPEELGQNKHLPIDSEEALDAINTAIMAGASYSFREMGTLQEVSRESLHQLNGARILVVDDRADTRELLTVLLETCGARVTSAASAAEAFEAVVSDPPQALVADLNMPLEDGFSLIRKVRALAPDAGGAIPAIALTALASDEDRAHALVSGFQLHMTKPVDIAELARAIAGLLSEPAAAGQSS